MLDETSLYKRERTWALLACGVLHSRRTSAHGSNKILHCPTPCTRDSKPLYKLSSLRHIVAENTLRKDIEVEVIASILNTENTFLNEERI